MCDTAVNDVMELQNRAEDCYDLTRIELLSAYNCPK